LMRPAAPEKRTLFRMCKKRSRTRGADCVLLCAGCQKSGF